MWPNGDGTRNLKLESTLITEMMCVGLNLATLASECFVILDIPQEIQGGRTMGPLIPVIFL